MAPPPSPSTNTDTRAEGVNSTNTRGAATSHRGARPRRCAAHPSRAPTTAPGSRTPSNVPNQSNVDSGPANWAMNDRSDAAHASPHTAPTSTGTGTTRRVPPIGSTVGDATEAAGLHIGRSTHGATQTALARATSREPPAVLDRARLGGVVDGDDPEPLPVAVGPLEVVHQRPHEVPVHPGARGDGGVHGGEVFAQVGGALGIGDAPVGAHLVGERGPVLGDHEREFRTARGQPRQQPGRARGGRSTSPSRCVCRSGGGTRRRRTPPMAGRRCRRGRRRSRGAVRVSSAARRWGCSSSRRARRSAPRSSPGRRAARTTSR